MGYLDNSTITVDAVLTNRGRELLSLQGADSSQFIITKFALADDEVDYRLYNSAHPLGSAAAGRVIEKMPILEASTDNTLVMKYKLITISGNEADGPGGSKLIPTLVLNTSLTGNSTTIYGGTAATTAGRAQFLTLDNIRTSTTTVGSSQEQAGYTVVIADSSLAKFESSYDTATQVRQNLNPAAASTATASGKKFKIIPTTDNASGTTVVTVYGNNTGATTSFNLTVVPQT